MSTALWLIAAGVLLAACSSPTPPLCVDLIVAAHGYELAVDSLEAEGWTILEGDTIAVKDADEGDCREGSA